MSPIVTVQRRMMELGRVRLGEKSASGAPKKRETFRFTTASQKLAEAVAERYGGKAQPWTGAPDEGYWEVKTDAHEIDIVLPPVFSDADGSPTLPFSQWLELWSGGGCQRRCDGVTEALSGKPCLCAPAVEKDGEDGRSCQPTTRLSFMLPDIPGLGVWRVESKGWNAAAELPGTLMILNQYATEGRFVPAALRLEPRTSKKGGQTRKYVVPVVDIPSATINQLAAGEVPLALNAHVPVPARPALPAGPAPPAEPRFENDTDPTFGAPPALPNLDANVPKATEPQKKKLNVLVGKLRDPGHITTEQLYTAMHRVPEPDADGEIHWAALRDTLSKVEAGELIERLERFEEHVSTAPVDEPVGGEIVAEDDSPSESAEPSLFAAIADKATGKTA